jgi:flagellar M-ring protein FliF
MLQQIQAVWQNVSLVQRALLLTIVLTVVFVGTMLTMWAKQPDMQVLYSGLDEEEAAKITEKISNKGIAYKLGGGGRIIYAPKEHISQLHLDMAKEGLPQGGLKGYSLFDDQPMGVSPDVQNINIKRALQEELARSIQMIDGVVSARIHLVTPKNSLFVSRDSNISASVILRLRPGHRLSALNIAAITHLVAGSVGGLKSETVTIVDSQGRLLSSESEEGMVGGAGTVADYRERVEQNLAEKVEKMLTTVLGPGRAKVEVSAEVDMTSTNLVTKKFDTKGVKTEEDIEKTSKPSGETGKETTQTINTKTDYGETVTTTAELPGKITSLTVAAFVDLSPPESATSEGETKTASASMMTVADVEDIIKNALGLKETDTLKVVNVKFNRPDAALLAGDDSGGGLDLVGIAGQASMGIMAVCALIVLKMFNGAKKKAGLAVNPGQLAIAGGTPAGAVSELSDSTTTLRKRIAGSLKSNPEQTRQLFTSWLDEKETD